MLGFIGAGNMADAIIYGVIESGFLPPSRVGVYDINGDKTSVFIKKYSIEGFPTAADLSKECDQIVLSVKPNALEEVLEEISGNVNRYGSLVMTIAAGKPLEFYEKRLEGARIIRIMPNINAAVSMAVSAYCPNDLCTSRDADFARGFCESFGSAVRLEEKFFPIFGVIGGCSPAFSYMFIDSLARAAVKHGMNKQTALKIAAAAVRGSAEMILCDRRHPWELVDMVCSPGGTTIEGVQSLEHSGFAAAVSDAVDAAANKDKKL